MKLHLLASGLILLSIISFSSCETDDVEPKTEEIKDPGVIIYGDPIIINEVLYDPSNSGLAGDANGDGVYGQDEDSFIEFFNASAIDVNVGGYQIWDDTTSGSNQYTFPAGTILPSRRALVVFGGGTPTGNFGGAVVLNAVSGFNFNNSGEVIGIKDTSGAWAFTFNSSLLSGNPNESYTRNPDITGEFEQHTANTLLLFSPGTKIDGTSF